MKIILCGLLTMGLLAASLPAAARNGNAEFSIGVIDQAGQGREIAPLRAALADADQENLAFVVVNGFKPASEPCTDTVYEQRIAALEKSKHGLFISLAASDWTACLDRQQRPAYVERLNRLREILFVDDFSVGASRLPLTRQSSTSIFRSYAENARWEINGVMFATMNVPANNNNYLQGAGRNSEFEDRQIANREWLQRIFSFATRKKMAAVVLFSDGDALTMISPSALSALNLKRDGYRELRKEITSLAARFPGKVLLVHGQAGEQAGTIAWQKNIGILGTGDLGSSWIKLTIRPSAADGFQVTIKTPER